MKKAFRFIHNVRLQFVILFMFISLNPSNAQWVQTPLTHAIVSSFAVKGTTFFVGTLDTLWRLDENSTIWTPAYVQEENSFSPMYFAVGDSAVFLAYKGGYPGYYLYSTYATNYTQWIPLTSSTPGFYFHVYCLAINGTGLFAGGNEGIYLFAGNTWTLCNGVPPYSINTLLAVSGSKLFAGQQYGGGFYGSSNGGSNWTQIGPGFYTYTNEALNALAYSGTNLIAGTSSGVFLSSNDGTSWTKFNTGLGVDTIVYSLAFSGTNIFAGTSKSVYLSTNNGANWTAVSTGLQNNTFTTLAVFGSYLYAGKNDGGGFTYGLWRRPLSEMISGIETTKSTTPDKFILQQNYPNPFNPNTLISYSLPIASHIKLIIYNTLGQSIKILENEYKNAGNYSDDFNAAGLPSGTYFFRLEADQFSQIKKMILLK